MTKNGEFCRFVPVIKIGTCPNSCGMAIGVAVGDSPFAPFTDHLGKPLIDDRAEFLGQWHPVYHVSNGPNRGGTYHRMVAVDKLSFDANGSIGKIAPSAGLAFD